jgi:hypothetical protein
MFKKFWQWLFPAKTTAQAVAVFTKAVTHLDTVVDQHTEIAAAHDKVIQEAAVLRADAVAEVAKATAVAEKIKAIL